MKELERIRGILKNILNVADEALTSLNNETECDDYSIFHNLKVQKFYEMYEVAKAYIIESEAKK